MTRHPNIRRATTTTAFTLTELLIVVGIIVLVAVLAVPSFRALSGGRSTEAAQNTIAAVLARARTEALGLQEPRGVFFYRDLESGRVGMALVRAMPELPGESSPDPIYRLDLVPDRDTVLLPVGVGIQFVDDDPSPAGGDNVDRYIGFNTRLDRTTDTSPNATVVPYGGVIMFDGKGRLSTETTGFRIRYPAGVAEMGRFLYNDPAFPSAGATLVMSAPETAWSKLGFVLFIEDEFTETFREGRGADLADDRDFQHDARITYGTIGTTPPSSPTNEAEEENWLTQNGVPFLINRYNGTLIRGE